MPSWSLPSPFWLSWHASKLVFSNLLLFTHTVHGEGRGGGSPISQELLLLTFQDFRNTLSCAISHSAENRAGFFPPQGIFPYPLLCFLESLLVKTLKLGGICTCPIFNWHSRLQGASISGSTPFFLHRCFLVLENLSGFPTL